MCRCCKNDCLTLLNHGVEGMRGNVPIFEIVADKVAGKPECLLSLPGFQPVGPAKSPCFLGDAGGSKLPPQEVSIVCPNQDWEKMQRQLKTKLYRQ